MAEQLLLTEELVDLDEVIMKIRSNESLIKAAEEENKQFKEQIKGLFLERNIESTRTEHFSVTVKTVKKNTFDPKRFRQDHEDVYNMYLKESSSTNVYIH